MTDSVPQQKSLMAQAKELLREHQVQVKKSLGQNFLINPAVLDKITRAANLTDRDLVFEVGPGLGVLTRQLIARCGHVIAVEVDRRMVELLNKTLGSPSNLSLIQKDILATEPAELIQQESARFSPAIPQPYHYKVVANLPYYITQAVIRRFCEAALKPDLMVIMVQKEVAKNIVASPGDLSLLAVSIQFFGLPRIVDIVPAGNFYPAPKVDSAILKIEMYPVPAVPVASEADFFKTVRAGFCAARKQVANALSQGLDIPRAEVLALMQKAGVEPQKRAETLTLAEWSRLTKVFFEERHK